MAKVNQSTEAAELEALEKQIALANAQPELYQRRAQIRSSLSFAKENHTRCAIEVERAVSILTEEKTIAKRVAASTAVVSFGLDRLKAAHDDNFGRLAQIDDAITASEFLSRTNPAKVVFREVELSKARKHADTAAQSLRGLEADKKAVDADIANSEPTIIHTTE